MNEFTKGEWYAKNHKVYSKEIGFEIAKVTAFGGAKSNAHLIATAGTTAAKLAEAGYDAQKVLEVLPELVANAEVGSAAHFYQLLEQCRGES